MPILRLLINQFVKGFADHKFCSLFSKIIHSNLILIQNSQTSDTFETMISVIMVYKQFIEDDFFAINFHYYFNLLLNLNCSST